MTRSLLNFESFQPFATRFFSEALLNRHLVNSYILRGRDMNIIYRMALRISEIINCRSSEDPLYACGECQSCKWIEENAHPAVITVSNMTYLTNLDPETGLSKSKTGKAQQSIAVDQLDHLLKELSLHSGGFHRVVILAGAEEDTSADSISETIPQPKDRIAGDRLRILPLDRRIFPERLANKFLKVLEEPPKDLIFFLLTDSEDKMLDTIVSRCQIVPFVTPSSFYSINLPPSARETLNKILNGNHDFLTQREIFTAFLTESGINSDEALAWFQQFLREEITPSSLSPERFQKIKTWLQHLERGRIMLRDKTKEDTLLEGLFLQMNS